MKTQWMISSTEWRGTIFIYCGNVVLFVLILPNASKNNIYYNWPIKLIREFVKIKMDHSGSRPYLYKFALFN